MPTILGELRRHFRDTGWAIHVPRALQELAVRLDASIDELQATLARAPTVAEIAEQLNTTPEQVLDARAAAGARHAASLESPIFDGDESRATFGDVIGALDDGLDAAEAAVTAQRLQRDLSERDRELLRLRFGEELTQREIGAHLAGGVVAAAVVIVASALRRRLHTGVAAPGRVAAAILAGAGLYVTVSLIWHDAFTPLAFAALLGSFVLFPVAGFWWVVA